MLVPAQTTGGKPPLFFVHGLHGVMPLGRIFAEGLGPEQPLYAIHANGMDGRAPVLDDLQKMVLAYVAEIQTVRPTGSIVIGGMCDGTLAAIEVARALQDQGRQIGPVILADPLPIPRQISNEGKMIESREPGVARQLYERVRTNLLAYASRPYNDMPFDASVAEELHRAVLAGVGALVALSTYNPRPFAGSMQVIVSAGRAASFFHPQMPWHELLPGPRTVVVLPFNHQVLFQVGRAAVARALKFLLQEADAQRQGEADPPSPPRGAHPAVMQQA
jgi:thioesterase domain-containing protein